MPSILADIYYAGSLLNEIMIMFTQSTAVLQKYLNNELKILLFVTIFHWGCTEFPEFSMFREIPEYSRFVASGHPVCLKNGRILCFCLNHILICFNTEQRQTQLENVPPQDFSNYGEMTIDRCSNKGIKHFWTRKAAPKKSYSSCLLLGITSLRVQKSLRLS